MKTLLISVFSFAWLMGIGQQDSTIDYETAIGLRPVYHEPVFGTCTNDSLSKQEMRECTQDAVVQFLAKNLKFPIVPHDHTYVKRAIVRFTIQKDGCITDIEFLRKKIPTVYEDEIKRVLNLMPRWQPAKEMNKIISIRYVIPILLPLR